MASKDDSSKPAVDKELDLSNAGRGVWLVKVPKYIANKWEKAPGNIDVGKLRIKKTPGQKAQVSLSLSDAVMNLEPAEKIPKDHRLDVSVVTKQTLGVFSHSVCKLTEYRLPVDLLIHSLRLPLQPASPMTRKTRSSTWRDGSCRSWSVARWPITRT